MISLETAPDNRDWREQLFNDGFCGSIQQIQVSKERVTQLLGILFDIDLGIIKPNPLIPNLPSTANEFYYGIAQHWLSRHPVLNKAEVRCSGLGLHGILRFDTPIVFHTDGERNRWNGIIKVVQAALPVDPDAPSITATTRSIGSINSKNGATVMQLNRGERVSECEVLSLYEAMKAAPFDTVLGIVAGTKQLSPCPFCQCEGTTLNAGRIAGFCYGSCGTIRLPRLYELLLKPRQKAEQSGVQHDR